MTTRRRARAPRKAREAPKKRPVGKGPGKFEVRTSVTPVPPNDPDVDDPLDEGELGWEPWSP